MPSMAALEGYVNDTSSALFSLARGSRRGRRRDRPSRPPCRPRLGDGAGDRSLPHDIARRQLFLPQQFLQQHGSVEEAFGQADPARPARRSTNWSRSAKAPEDGDGLLADVPRKCAPPSCRWRWSAATSSGCRAVTPTLCVATGAALPDAVGAVARLALAGICQVANDVKAVSAAGRSEAIHLTA